MSDLLAARWQMGVSLAFHIIFASIGIAMPLLMVMAEWRWHRTGDQAWLILARRWSKGKAVLFAVGAVSGTVLSFELGLLWPRFMEFAGAVVGMPFSLEGFAFFTEAIFLGVYLYGWERVSPRIHMAAGVIVALSGAASAVFVVMVNAWMNAPVGVTMNPDGSIAAVDVLAGMRSPVAFAQSLHMLLAAYAATGLAVAGLHAIMLLRGSTSPFHKHALAMALVMGAPAALLQPISGDISARAVARTQPVKLAAMEAQWETEHGAPLRVGGWPDETSETTRWAIEIPYGLSLLAFHDPNAEVQGLKSVPPELRPPVTPVHLSFQVMIALGTLMALVSAWVVLVALRKRELATNRRLLTALALLTPAGFIAIEAGWIVTEVGRQPWTVHGLLRTSDAVTPMPGLIFPLALFVALYTVLALVVWAVLRSMVRDTSGPWNPAQTGEYRSIPMENRP
jgi:cytochrome d ubiquinol oxidase subunit I